MLPASTWGYERASDAFDNKELKMKKGTNVASD